MTRCVHASSECWQAANSGSERERLVIRSGWRAASNGQLTFQPHTFRMNLPYTTFPTIAYIQMFAVNSNGVRAYAKLSNGMDRIDTVQVVAGVTRSLPFGGQVADALYLELAFDADGAQVYALKTTED